MKQIKWVGAHPNNFQAGRDGTPIRRFIVHATEGSMQSTANWFNNPKARVSAHYGIDKHGNIEQYVSDSDVAFHAGNLSVNKDSIGIELEDIMNGVEPTDEQYEAIAWLIQAKSRLYSIVPSDSTIEPHKRYRATLCPGDTNVGKIIQMVQGKEEPLPRREVVVINIKGFEPVVFKGDLVISDDGRKIDVRLRD
jgi:N-acetylmuramoyl-L-alanine amidase CwlA